MDHNNIVLFTGGGSAGHVVPSLPIIDVLHQKKCIISYIGSKKGIERTIIQSNKAHITYYAITTGKFRRYISFKNVIDFFKIFVGIIQSYYLIKKIKPKVIFSKGGYVAFPVVVAGWLNKTPVIIHESDLTPGLANRLSYPFANRVCVTFDKTIEYFPKKNKVTITGSPIRQELLQGNIETAKNICKFPNLNPVILIIGGGSGSIRINVFIRKNLDILLTKYNVIHICGSGKIECSLNDISGYIQLEYADQELPHLLAYADLVIARAGANTIWELIALKKPHILIPLSLMASRGDQIHNANFCKINFGSKVVFEEDIEQQLISTIHDVMDHFKKYNDNLAKINLKIGNQSIVALLEALLMGNI